MNLFPDFNIPKIEPETYFFGRRITTILAKSEA